MKRLVERQPQDDTRQPRGASLTGALQALADSSPMVGRARSLQATASARPSIQFHKKHKKSGIEYAESESEARTVLTAYADRLGYVFAQLDDGLKEHSLRAAQDHSEGGIDGAERLIWGYHNERVERQRQQDRAEAIKAAADDLEEGLSDPLAVAAFKIARGCYVGMRPNAGMAGTYTNDEYEDARADWDSATAGKVISNFHSFEAQDKEAAGKGNVGATLATRKVQGNLLCVILGHKINVHVDIVG